MPVVLARRPGGPYAAVFAGRSGGTTYRSLNTWDDTYNEGGSSDGNVYIGKAFDAMAVHTYTFSCFDMANTQRGGEAPGGRWQDVITYYAQRGSAIIYITEAAVNDSSYDTNKWVNYMAARCVQSTFGFDAVNSPYAINSSGGQANGRVKGVTFFQTNYNDPYTFGHLAQPSGNPYYNIDEGAANRYGGHQKIGNRDTANSGCNR